MDPARNERCGQQNYCTLAETREFASYPVSKAPCKLLKQVCLQPLQSTGRKPSVSEEDIWAWLRLPCLQMQGHTGRRARVGNTSQEPHSIRCSPALVFSHFTHEAQMVSRVREKGVLLTQAMPYFSKYHMPSRHSGPDPISVRLCSTGDLAPPAHSKLHSC